MKRVVRIITNASYKDFFNDTIKFQQEEYLMESLNNYETLDTNSLSRLIALVLQEQDLKEGVKYGIEIKSNGGSRSSRIPLVRITRDSASIWKVSRTIKDLEKTLIALDDLEYFLITHNNTGYLIPSKVVILAEDVSRYSTVDSQFDEFVLDKAIKHNVVIISLNYLRNILTNNVIELDNIIGHSGVFII